MKQVIYIVLAITLAFIAPFGAGAQNSNTPAPYCTGNYSSGNCNQGGPSNTPGNSVNDFINTFITSGGTDNISNVNSGCNGGPSNYINYCGNYITTVPGQVITCTVQSGITYGQGFAIFIDWNQDNVFNLPSELVASTPNAPPAGSFNTLTFTVPLGLPNGAYRLRVRCAFATPGPNITPCGQFSFGEIEDYTLYIGPIPATSAVVTATATGNATICPGQQISLGVTATPATATFTWTGPNNFFSTLQNPVINNAPSVASGIYSVTTSGGCPAQKTVTVLVAPDASFSISPSSAVICQGNCLHAGVQLANNPFTPNIYSYVWSGSAPPGTFQSGGFGTGIFSPNTQTTLICPGNIVAAQTTLIYTVVVSPTVMSCPVVHTMTLTINNPVTPALTLPAPLCNNSGTVLLTATPGGGTWSANAAVQANGVFTPSVVPTPGVGTETVVYSVAVGTCIVQNTGTISVSKYNTPALSSSLSTLCSTLEPLVDLMSLVSSTVNGSWHNSVLSIPSLTYVSNNILNSINLPSGVYTATYLTLSTPSVLNTCPDSTIFHFPVFNPPAPVITPIPQLCSNASTIQLTATPTLNLLWTGNQGVSSTGVLSPSACLIGTTQITCTGGLGTCVASSTAAVQISTFPSAAFTATVPPLCVTSNIFNLLSINQNVNGTWSCPVGGAVVSNSFQPLPLYIGEHTYTLTYTNISSIPGLCNQTNTIAVSVLNPPSPNILQVGPYCNNAGPVQLTVTPNSGVWSASSYITPGGLFTPSLSAVGNSIVRYVIGTSTCNTQQTASISVEGFVPAAISHSIADQCNTNAPVNLLPFTLSNLGTWSGPGILAASFNPAVAGTGNIILTHNTASSPSGLCPDQATIAVNVYSLATPVFSNVKPLCNSAAPFKVQVSPVGGIFGGANNTAVTRVGVFNPALGIIGDNIINYSITSGPCVAYSQATVAIEKFIPAGFDASVGPYCKNDRTLFKNLNDIAQNPGGEWYGDGVNSNGLFTFASAVTGDNLVKYKTHSYPTTTLCPDYNTITIKVYDTPQVLANSNVLHGCAPVQVRLNTPSFNDGVGTWNFGDGSEPEDGLTLNHTFTAPGNYSVTFTYSVVVAANFGCLATATVNPVIKIFETPKADFIYAPDAILISDPEVHFENTTTNKEKERFVWTISGNGVEQTSYELDPHIIFPQVGDYKVKLSVSTLNNCTNEITKTLSVKTEFNVYIPGSFTPNGDGINDYFFPVFTEYGLDDRSYDMQIFDRWGSLLFQTKDKSMAWDGKKSGQVLKQDVYVYKLRYKDLDGNVYNKTGYVSIIK